MPIYEITPVAKPRMTQRDKWLKPPRYIVARYWYFKDLVRGFGVDLSESGAHVIFYMPMPESWSKKKRERMNGEPHKQVPDIDNLQKALLDALFDNDSHVWDIRATKRWAVEGSIVINHGDERKRGGGKVR